jgi:hypothetical protein
MSQDPFSEVAADAVAAAAAAALVKETGVVGLVVDIMARHESNELHRAGVGIIYQLVSDGHGAQVHRRTNAEAVIREGGVASLVSALRSSPEDVDMATVVTSSLAIMLRLIGGGPFAEGAGSIYTHMVEAGALPVVQAAVVRFNDNPTVQGLGGELVLALSN